jgi:hypothetical protein
MGEFAQLFIDPRPPGPPGKGSPSGPQPRLGAPAPDVRDLAQFLSQAWLAYVASGLRYWSRLADAWARTLPSVAHAFAQEGDGKRPEGRAVQLDELRSRLRDLAEIPSQESRILQAELDRLASGLWPETDARQDGEYWRRWETKP